MRLRTTFGPLLAVIALLFATSCGSSGTTTDRSDGTGGSDTTIATDGSDTDTDDTTGSDDSEGDGIVVVETGVVVTPDREGNDETNVVAVVRNTTDKTAIDAAIDLIAVDADGNELHSDTTYIDALLPGASYPVGYGIEEPDGDVTDVKVDIDATEWEDAPGDIGGLTTGDITIGEPSTTGERQLSGDVTSTMGVTLDRAEFLVLLRTADGTPALVSSGYTEEVAPGATVPGDTPIYTPIPDGWTAEGFASPTDFDTLH